MQNFIHLRLHSEYSITESILRIKDAVKRAKSDQMFALGITDLHNMFGVIKFYKSCRDNGIKPIVGVDLSVTDTENNPYKILVLVKNIHGYRELSDLISRSYIENKIFDIPYVKEEWLLNKVHENLIVLSGAHLGDIGQLILQNKDKKALEKVELWHKAFPDSYYLELQRITHEGVDLVVAKSVEIASKLNLPVVATHPILFATANDYVAHEVRVCVASGAALDDEKRHSKYSQDQYFTSQKEMIELFSDIPSSITNTLEIAKRCNFEITLGKYFLPDFVAPNGMVLEEYLSTIANNGLDERLREIYKDQSELEANEPRYRKRLEIEIETIIQMGFSGYFLIVADFINWAKQNNVAVGPGRGSGAGSLVAFVLRITDVEPLRYGLLFERFLNSERVSMPDFDIDFDQDRELVIEYVKNKYGVNAVAQIATFGTMSSKAVIKDVGRVLSLSYGLCDSISKQILNTPAKSFTLLEAYDKFPELKEKIDSGDEDVTRLWELSLQLEDLPRSVGKHAAGVLIAPSKLTDFCPIYIADGMQTSQLDKDDVESVGLVKFDFLGLRNLTIIKDTIKNIKELDNIDVVLSNYEFEDKAVYELLKSGNAAAIFQLESPGMKRVLTKLEPDRFEDIIALLALYRPGPLGSGMVDDFIKRKKGIDVVDYFHDDLKACLEPTYGVIVYQEQVMQISQIIGGYTLGGADLLRRAMGKKKPEEMAKHKNLFIEGALKKGYTHNLAESLFDLMAKFAEYGFNKSHSAAYAIISYHTAYLKTHHLACFMAATLSAEMDKTDKVYEFYQDCLYNNLTILPPDINHSNYTFVATNHTTIRYALGAIKGVGQNVVEIIVNEREINGSFTSFADFCYRVDKKVLSKKTLESLVKAGAFDCFDSSRAKLFNNINKILDAVEQERQNANQGSLFDAFTEDPEDSFICNNEIILDDYPVWTLKEQLHAEKQALGYYYSASLFDEYHDVVKKLDIDNLAKYHLDTEEMQEFINSRSREKHKVLLCGIINYIGSKPLKKGGKIVFVNIEDDASDLEFVIFNEDFDKYKHLIKIDEMVFVEGELMFDSFRNQIKLTAKHIYSLDEILAEQIGRITINIDNKINLDYLKPMISNNGVKLRATYINDQASCRLEFGDSSKFIVKYEHLKELNQILGKHAWSIN